MPENTLQLQRTDYSSVVNKLSHQSTKSITGQNSEDLLTHSDKLQQTCDVKDTLQGTSSLIPTRPQVTSSGRTVKKPSYLKDFA